MLLPIMQIIIIIFAPIFMYKCLRELREIRYVLQDIANNTKKD